MKPLQQETLRVALVPTIALAARLAFVVWWQRTHLASAEQFEFPDSPSYWELGQHMARGEPYQFGSPDRSVFRAPGYPLLLAAMFRVVGMDAKPVAARVMGAVIGALTVGCVYWLARILFSAEVAIVAVYPEAVATSVFPLSDGPFCLWMMLELVLVGYAWAGRKWSSCFAILAGAMGGVATLTRPSCLLFTPGLVAVWWIGSRFERRRFACWPDEAWRNRVL